MYYPCSENEGADQLCGYREAGLRLCFCLCRLLVFPCGSSNVRNYLDKSCNLHNIMLHCAKECQELTFLVFSPTSRQSEHLKKEHLSPESERVSKYQHSESPHLAYALQKRHRTAAIQFNLITTRLIIMRFLAHLSR